MRRLPPHNRRRLFLTPPPYLNPYSLSQPRVVLTPVPRRPTISLGVFSLYNVETQTLSSLTRSRVASVRGLPPQPLPPLLTPPARDLNP